jgi:APA family basic amino acid/polyamine antiporter
LVQSLGLFSSTAIVIGSMIGSGIYIVDADIARGTSSPALFLGAWIVTAILTLIGALSYGELAAMMPKAGGQYVYLRESLGPLWGFLYGWTLFLVIQTGTIAAVCRGLRQIPRRLFPGQSRPPIGYGTSPTYRRWRVGPMVLGNMEIGVNTANLTGIAVVLLLAVVNIFGVRLGALIQNVFTTAKALSLAAL